VLASSENPAIVLCGVDTVLNLSKKYYQGRGIFASLDTGRTWFPIGASNYRVFELAEHPLYPRHIAAACDLGGVFISSATGFFWDQMSSGLPENVPIRSVAVPNWDVTENGFIAFAGTEGQGIYKSQRVYTSVEDRFVSINSVYPNPATDRISISFEIKEITRLKIELYDLLGNSKAVLFDDIPSSSSFNASLLLPQDIADGCYFIFINSIKGSSRFPIIIKK